VLKEYTSGPVLFIFCFFEIVVPQSLDPARYVFLAGFAAAGPMAIPTVCAGSAPADLVGVFSSLSG